jgi:hypothetical protein
VGAKRDDPQAVFGRLVCEERVAKPTPKSSMHTQSKEHHGMKLFRSKKAVALGATVGLALGLTGVAFSYFTTDGAGSGDASVGTSTSLVIHQDDITYSNSATDDILLPGTSATVTFTVDNPSSGHQYLDTISVTGVTSDKAGCNSTAHPSWFDISDTDVVQTDYAPGDGQAVTGDLTVEFVNQNESQDACKDATLTFAYASN